MKTGATDTSKDFLRQELSNADEIVDDIRNSLEDDTSIDEETRGKYDDVLSKLSIKINQLKNEIDYI